MRQFLIVDDLENIRKLMIATLKIFDADFITADNGKDAVRLTKEHKPDIVIMDILMPGKIDGFQALKEIRENNETKDIKIILLTTKDETNDKKTGYNSGASGYLTKPFRPVELINLVESLL